jgi:hypothetical protein
VIRDDDDDKGYGLDDRGSIPGRSIEGFFLLATASNPALGPI